MSNHDELLDALFGLSPEVARALLAKFRAAERRHGRSLPPSYLRQMAHNHQVDLVRAAERAERAAARALIEQAKAVERERRAEVFVQAEVEFEELVSMDWAARLTPVQEAQLHVLRLAYFHDLTHDQLAARLHHSKTTIWQWISRGRRMIKRRVACLGFDALREVVVEGRLSPLGGVVGFRDDC